MTLLRKGSYPFFSTVALLLLLLLMAMFATATASAQTTGHDPRWRAWLGCWLSSPLRAIPAAAIEEARALVVAPLATSDVIDAAAHVNGVAVEAWLGELRQQFHIDARRLVEFSRAHVPDRVIDLLVALSYPDAF